VSAIGLEKFNTVAKPFGKGHFAIHAFIGEVADLLHDIFALGIARQSDVSEFVQAFNFGEGTVKINNVVGLLECVGHYQCMVDEIANLLFVLRISTSIVTNRIFCG
jgi:hypothetical protein